MEDREKKIIVKPLTNFKVFLNICNMRGYEN